MSGVSGTDSAERLVICSVIVCSQDLPRCSRKRLPYSYNSLVVSPDLEFTCSCANVVLPVMSGRKASVNKYSSFYKMHRRKSVEWIPDSNSLVALEKVSGTTVVWAPHVRKIR